MNQVSVGHVFHSGNKICFPKNRNIKKKVTFGHLSDVYSWTREVDCLMIKLGQIISAVA